MLNSFHLRLPLVVSIDRGEDLDVSVGAFRRDDFGHLSDIRRAEGGGPLAGRALELGEEVALEEASLHRGRVAVSEGVAVIGGEEVVSDPFAAESEEGEAVPHELTVARLEVMRPTVGPDLDLIEISLEI